MSAAAHSRPTRADVARLAGVSTATVSYVLNDVPNKVSPETAQRVKNAAAMMGYRSNAFARALKTGTSKTFGVVVSDFSNPYFASLNDEIEAAAAEHGYSVIFANSRGEAQIERTCIAQLQDRNVDVIFTSSAMSNTELASLDHRRCRLIFLDHPVPVHGVKCVSTDFAAATETMTNHLLQHGHTNIVLLYGGSDMTDARIIGWERAHQAAELPTGRVLSSGFSRQGGYEATMTLLDSDNPPTALFAASDLEALGALHALHKRGVRVPDDIALVSFDGSVDTLFSQPELTTMHQDTHAIAHYAVQAALNPNSSPDAKLIESKLMIRESCGCK